MTTISREEIIKLARMSTIYLAEEEIEPLRQQLMAVLTYAARVQEIVQHIVPEEVIKPSNIYRPDTIIRRDPELFLGQAPQTEGNYFVVPKILENT